MKTKAEITQSITKWTEMRKSAREMGLRDSVSAANHELRRLRNELADLEMAA